MAAAAYQQQPRPFDTGAAFTAALATLQGDYGVTRQAQEAAAGLIAGAAGAAPGAGRPAGRQQRGRRCRGGPGRGVRGARQGCRLRAVGGVRGRGDRPVEAGGISGGHLSASRGVMISWMPALPPVRSASRTTRAAPTHRRICRVSQLTQTARAASKATPGATVIPRPVPELEAAAGHPDTPGPHDLNGSPLRRTSRGARGRFRNPAAALQPSLTNLVPACGERCGDSLGPLRVLPLQRELVHVPARGGDHEHPPHPRRGEQRGPSG